MKMTETQLRRIITICNGNSKHLGVGLDLEKADKTYTLRIKYRKGGKVITTLDEMTASETAAALRMFNKLALITEGESYGATVRDIQTEPETDCESEQDQEDDI